MGLGRGLRTALALVAFVGVIGWIVWAQFGAERVRDVEDLQVGDCVRVPSGDFTDVLAVPAMDCDREHNAELYLIGRLDRGRERDYPGAESVRSEALELCRGPEFVDYVGAPPDEVELEMVVMWPSEVDWRPTRGVVYCFVRLPGEESTSERLGEATPVR